MTLDAISQATLPPRVGSSSTHGVSVTRARSLSPQPQDNISKAWVLSLETIVVWSSPRTSSQTTPGHTSEAKYVPTHGVNQWQLPNVGTQWMRWDRSSNPRALSCWAHPRVPRSRRSFRSLAASRASLTNVQWLSRLDNCVAGG